MSRLSLIAPLTVAVAACAGPARIPARVQLTVAALEADDATPAPDVAPIVCEGDATYCTPSNLSGRIHRALVMWGQLGPGAHGIELLDGGEAGLEFSLIESEIVASSVEEVDGGGGAKPLPRLEFLYDYLDATFTLAGPINGGSAGEWQVRTVFVTSTQADDVAGTLYRGDKLVRGPSDQAWRWCNAEGCSEDRAAVADGLITEQKLVDYIYPGQGPRDYIPFAVPLDPPLSLSANEINTPQSLWSCAFDMVDAIRLQTAPAEITAPQALLTAFELAYAPDQQHAGTEVRISASVTFTRGASPEPEPAPGAVTTCVTACARVATCYGFEDGLYGASESDCQAGCSAQDAAAIGQLDACLGASDCADRSAIAGCFPASDAP
ncbi:MAG: hypothetical protein KC635_11140 [Myxococcales bacterium]|nr:hypothetical protein [Myxococcales bacterium]